MDPWTAMGGSASERWWCADRGCRDCQDYWTRMASAEMDQPQVASSRSETASLGELGARARVAHGQYPGHSIQHLVQVRRLQALGCCRQTMPAWRAAATHYPQCLCVSVRAPVSVSHEKLLETLGILRLLSRSRHPSRHPRPPRSPSTMLRSLCGVSHHSQGQCYHSLC